MEIKEMIAVLQAFEEGKEIEYLPNDGNFGVWNRDPDPNWNFDATIYRIKPEPTREEITQNWVKEHGIVIGSKVKVVKKVNDDRLGWASGMDFYIGELAYVEEISSKSLELSFRDMQYAFPIESLEPYKETYIPFTWDDRDLFRGKWVRWKHEKEEFTIDCILPEGLSFGEDAIFYYKDLLTTLEFIDGSVFGKLKI